jgi:hypothetical protein
MPQSIGAGNFFYKRNNPFTKNPLCIPKSLLVTPRFCHRVNKADRVRRRLRDGEETCRPLERPQQLIAAGLLVTFFYLLLLRAPTQVSFERKELAIEREGDGRDEGNAERQEGNLGGFHGACSWIMDVLVCEALRSQYEQSHATPLLNVFAFTGSANVTNMSKKC